MANALRLSRNERVELSRWVGARRSVPAEQARRAHLVLLLHELRNARTSLAVAAVLNVVCLAVIHLTAGGPIQAATALPLLWCFCALQFACDSFAVDLSSGRLSTRAALPIGAGALWNSKLAGFTVSLALIAAWGVSLELAWQGWSVGAGGSAAVLGALPSAAKALPIAALIGAVGMTCSLLVDSALTAMLLSSLVLGALWGLSLAIAEGAKVIGPSFLSEHPVAAAFAIAAAFLSICRLAFTRAQRKLGDAAIRTRIVLVGALVLTLGITGAIAGTSTYWETYGLEDPRTNIHPPVASPDGRFIVFESTAGALSNGTARDARLLSVWAVDLDTAKQRLLAGPGMIVRNSFGSAWSSWSEKDGLRIKSLPTWAWEGESRSWRLRVVGDELVQQPIADTPLLCNGRMPEWALVEVARSKKPGVREVRVRWKGTEFERKFDGYLGRDVILSPQPGRVIVRREESLVQVELASSEERTLVDGGVVYVELSPDGQGLLAMMKPPGTRVLSTVDGSDLHAPWRRGDSHWPRWIHGDERSHLIHLGPTKRGVFPRILDLDSGREIEIADHQNQFFARVADRGFVMIDEHQNLVWIDRDGKPVKVLVKRN